MDNKENKNKYPKIPEKYRVEYIGRPEDKQREGKRIIYRVKHWHNLKLWWNGRGRYSLKTILRSVFIIGIIAFFIWGIVSDKPVDISTNNVNPGISKRDFPTLREPKTVTFEWEYKGSKYFITKTLYRTVYDYYNSSPEKNCLLKEEGSREDCYKRFLKEAKGDNTISEIASSIKGEASKNGLSNDELVELTIAFVQAIPYDQNKYELIKSLPKFYSDISEVKPTYPRYPYEVLYDDKGICTGKTFLATSLIEKLGYGVAWFSYEPVKEGGVGHIAPAIKCPERYSSYNSGYCCIEVTGKGFKIGDMPKEIDAGVAKIRTPINVFEEKNAPDFDGLKDPKIYVVADGDSYYGIINTVQTIRRIETLEKEIARLHQIINSLDEECKHLENSVKYYEQQGDSAYRDYEIFRDSASYNEYVRLYSQYDSVYTKYKSEIDEYNKEVNKYNNLVHEYNALIKDFYR